MNLYAALFPIPPDLNLCLVKFLATRDELAAERDKLEDKLAEVLSEVNEATEKDAEGM